jgi:hypothetical protein
MNKSKPLKILSSILQAIGLSATCVLANYAWAANPYIDGPSYLLPYAGELDNSWIGSLGLPNQNPIAAPLTDIPTTVIVDGQRKIDLTTEGAAFEKIASEPLIEIAIPGHNTRYVFTSIQNFTDFSIAADLPMIERMVEHAKYLVSIGKDPFADLSWATQLSQGKQQGELKNTSSQTQENLNSPFEVLGNTAEQTFNVDLPTQSSAKRLMPGGWDTDESVWVMNYEYRQCNYGSRGILGSVCGQSSNTVPILSYDSTIMSGPRWYWPYPSGDDDDTAVVAARGQHQNHVYIGLINTNQICELDDGAPEYYNGAQGCHPDDSWLSGGFFTDAGGPRAYLMGRFADLTISTQTAPLPQLLPSDDGRRRTELHNVVGHTVLVKSPVFWSFCTMFARCRTSFGGLPDPTRFGALLISWQNFRLIPDARRIYFSNALASSMTQPDIQQTQVKTYREQASITPGLAGLFSDNGLRTSALIEAATGCDTVILPPRYLNHVTNTMVDRGAYCAVPRMIDGRPLLQVFDNRAMPVPAYVDPFFYPPGCVGLENRGEANDPYHTCRANPCRLIYLDLYRYNLSVIAGGGTGLGFESCPASLYRRPEI